jgi:hypothetical protein
LTRLVLLWPPRKRRELYRILSSGLLMNNFQESDEFYKLLHL